MKLNSHMLPGRGGRYLFGAGLFLPIVFLLSSFRANATTYDTIPAGSFIINMGVTPQTIANGLKPYGLVYDLVKNYVVPIKWVIKPGKAKDDIDFSHNGIDYRGGPFIVPAKYRTATVNARIAYWQGLGVVGATTTAPIVVPVHTTLKAMPTWTLDDQNGQIAEDFIIDAGIPATAYNWLAPAQLTCCNDIFAMPHADPKWPTHGNLYTWNLSCDGAIWLGCHAGSALEDLFNPANKSQQMNFLSVKTGNAVGSGPYEENALVLWGNHSDGSPPYSYAYHDDPMVQFMGILDAATQNGSEQIYLPKVSWRPGARVYAWDPTHVNVPAKSPGPAAVLISGRAFDDPNRGRVMLEAAHDIGKSSAPANIAAERAFFNFSYFSANEKAVIPDISAIPDTLVSGIAVKFTYNLPPSVDSTTYTTQWTADCGGTFSPNSTTKTVYYTPPAVVSPTPCLITVQIRDACNRVFNDAKPISIQCVLAVTATTTNPTCNGASNGAITMNMTGGTAPYSWNWSRVSPTGSGTGTGTTITGLSAGTYNVTVSSAGGCKTTFTSTLANPPILTASAAGTNVLCNGQSTGSINLTVGGGTAPYTYNWGGGVTSQNRTGLAAGTYTVTVTDSKGCTATASATLTQPSALVINTSITNVNCNGQSTGSIILSVTGGTPAYSFNWGGGVTTQNRTGLAAGTYTVTVTDLNGCTATASATVTQPLALVVTTTSGSVSCNGGSNGSITTTVSGGAAPYTYAWSNGSTTQNLSGLAAGNYTLTVTDNNSCKVIQTVTVTQPAVLALSTSVTNVSCNGQSNGAITLTVTGGTPAYSYNWGGGITTQNRTGLTAGTYVVTVTDQKGCTATTSATVTQPAVLALSTTVTNVSCNGQSNGAITLTVTGGTPAYSYNWGGGVTTQNRTGLAAGTYTVTVTDLNGCTAVATSNVTQPAALTLSATAAPVSCNGGSNGSVTTTSGGGTAPYAYAWSNGSTTANLSGLSAGTYTVTLTDSKGCTAIASATVTQPAVLSLTTTITPINCFGQSTGAINLTATGGNPGYTYLWNGGITTQNRTGLGAGTYSVTVTDTKGCTATTSVTLTQPALLAVSTTIADVNCNGQSTGAINLTVTGGTPVYSFNWGGGITTQNRTGLSAGTYSVTVTDVNGCTATAVATVSQPLALSISTTAVGVSCNGGSNGSIATVVTGGTPAYNYAWSNGSTSQNLSGLSAGTYTLTVTDSKGCTATASVAVSQPAALTASVTVGNVSCNGLSNGSITLTVSGGTPAFVYTWSDGVTTQNRTGLSAGTYTVTVTDNKGCTTSQTATINQAASLNIAATITNVSCNGQSNGAINLTVSGGTPGYTYNWGGGVTTQNRTGLTAGTYSVTVTDANGCTGAVTAVVNQPAVLAISTSVVAVSCNGGSNGSISATITGGTPSYTYLWSNGSTSQNLTGLSAGTYTLTVTDGNGCTAVSAVNVNQPAALVITPSVTNLTCHGIYTGAITLTVSGGTPAYTYDWGGGVTTQNRTGLGAGTYTVTVTDSKGCTAVSSVTITQPTMIALSPIITDVACFGQSTGAINLGVSGGTPGYTYNWGGGITTQNRSGLAVGNYSVTVTDANGCTKTTAVAIGQPAAALALSSVVTNIDCGVGTGAINLTATGGTPAYTFKWSDGPTTEDRSGLAVGSYTVTVTDAQACTAVLAVSITSTVNPSLSVSVTNILCYGGKGSIGLTVTGGVGPYTYAWSDGATTEDRTNLNPGTYTVTVTSSQGCFSTLTATVTSPAAPLGLSATMVNVSCYGGSNGSVDLTVTGGTAPYTYQWSTGATTQDVSGLAAGSYAVTVTDANGCSSVLYKTIIQPTALSLSIQVTNAICPTDLNGALDLNVIGGTAPYTYSWSNGATTQDLINIGVGTYTVTVTDANGCTATAGATVINVKDSPATPTGINH